MPFRLTASTLGPVLGGFLYDGTGNYVLAFSLFVGAFLLAGLVALTARPPSR